MTKELQKFDWGWTPTKSNYITGYVSSLCAGEMDSDEGVGFHNHFNLLLEEEKDHWFSVKVTVLSSSLSVHDDNPTRYSVLRGAKSIK